MRIIPPNLFVRLRQEMAASRINKLLYASTSRTFADTAAATYMSLENDRLKEERGLLDGVDKSKSKFLKPPLRSSQQRVLGRVTD